MAQTIGSFLGVIIYKIIHALGKQRIEHNVLCACGISFATGMITFVMWNNTFGQWLAMIMMGAAYYCTVTSVNVCMIEIIDKKNGVELLLGYGFSGVGSFLAPQLTKHFEEKSYLLMSVFYLVMATLCFTFIRPQQKGEKSFNAVDTEKKVYGSKKLEMMFGLSLFLVLGMGLTTNGWIPSYAVRTGACRKEETSKFSAIYYTIMMLMRFLSPKVAVSTSRKLSVFLPTMLAVGLFCVFCQCNEFYGAATTYGSIGYAFSCSLMYPLMMLLPSEYGISFKPAQTANILVWTVFSSGFLSGLTGTLMRHNIQLLFYSLITMSTILLCVVLAIIRQMKKEVQKAK